MVNNYDRLLKTKVRWSNIISQIIILCILFFLPEVLFSIGKPLIGMIYIRPIPYILLFYLNYYFLVDKYLFDKRHKYLFFLFNFMLIIVFVAGIYGIVDAFRPEFAHHGMPQKGMGPPPKPDMGLGPDDLFEMHAIKIISFLVRDGVILVLTVALSVALKLGDKWLRWDRMQSKLLAERQESELRNLKNQLNPHFLFNTLNNIYSLIAIAPDKAQKSVHDLSHLLRYVLYDNNDKEVLLEKDLDFVANYIELMRLRLTSNVDLNVNIQRTGLDDKKIAPLLFISLIENAFKHGVSPSKKSFINIDIRLENNNEIKCKVENTYFPKDETDKSGSGIGLRNLEKQLSILYPGNFVFNLTHDNETFVATLNIKLTSQKL